MGLLKILKIITGGVGSTTGLFSKSLKSIDDLIEKEHITGSIDKAKEMTGDVVQKAGEIFEKGKMKVEEFTEDKSYEPIGEVIEEYKEKAKDISERIFDKIEDVKNSFNEEE